MPKEKESLKDILKKLDVIVTDLNGKDVDVEKGMEKFKEGIELVKEARSRLKKVENEFITLKKELDKEQSPM